MAAAAIEWAEIYQRQGRGRVVLLRGLPLIVVIFCGAGAVLFAIDGDVPLAILNGLIVLINLLHLMYNPAVRPQSVARSLEASRGIVAAG